MGSIPSSGAWKLAGNNTKRLPSGKLTFSRNMQKIMNKMISARNPFYIGNAWGGVGIGR
jgi:hypothetical protein